MTGMLTVITCCERGDEAEAYFGAIGRVRMRL